LKEDGEEIMLPKRQITKEDLVELKSLQGKKAYTEFYEFQAVLGQGAFCKVY